MENKVPDGRYFLSLFEDGSVHVEIIGLVPKGESKIAQLEIDISNFQRQGSGIFSIRAALPGPIKLYNSDNHGFCTTVDFTCVTN